MVRVTDYKVRKSSKGNSFFALVVQGGMEAVRSRDTGQIYFKLKTATVQTAFDEETCENLVDKELNGRIEKVKCEPYEVENQDTGEVIELCHRNEYIDEELERIETHVVNQAEVL